jgi:hypothetical protein
MFNPSTSKEYKAPIGRIAQVQSIQDYSKTQRLKVSDFFGQKHIRNPKNRKTQYDDYRRHGNQDFPGVHRDTIGLQQGKEKKIFKQDKLFEMNPSDSKNEKKKNKNKKESTKPKKPKKLILDYKNEFHTA